MSGRLSPISPRKPESARRYSSCSLPAATMLLSFYTPLEPIRIRKRPPSEPTRPPWLPRAANAYGPGHRRTTAAEIEAGSLQTCYWTRPDKRGTKPQHTPYGTLAHAPFPDGGNEHPSGSRCRPELHCQMMTMFAATQAIIPPAPPLR
jgi:hypothetical protein